MSYSQTELGFRFTLDGTGVPSYLSPHQSSTTKMRYLLLLIIPLFFTLASCEKDEKFTTSGDDKLEFSVDTLRFDTVFTELGSATRFFRVYNRAGRSIKISKITLQGNEQSKFNLNVDGLPGDVHEDVTVLPHDSIYVFAEVTIDPDAPLSESPYVVEDEVLFETNGNEQSVKLEAWGQNANYIPSRWHKDSIVVFGCGGGEVVWDDPKPYVVYGIVAFEECTLRLPAGAKVHVHGGLSRAFDENDELVTYNSGRLFIGPNASLVVEGTLEDPVIIEGDRLEEGFEDEDGQWTGVVFAGGSTGNSIDHAIVKNSLFGIFIDSAAELSLKNTQVINTSGPAIFAQRAKVDAENCLFYNNFTNSVALTFGGDYNFDYCTLANFGTDQSALSLGNGFCDDPLCVEPPPRIYRLNARFRNCIVFGSRRDEISLNDFTFQQGADPTVLNYSFENCVIRTDEINDAENGYPDFFDHVTNGLNATSQDALFFDANQDDYHLDTLSVAEEKGVPLPGILLDLEGNDRDVAMPDVGCFEYQFE